MIRVKTIHIEEFRGIRKLDLNFDGKNFGICGPNGTGKSGIVDAIEFCLTGDVTRLSGQGSAGLTVKTHGPHVDQQHKPEDAQVTITAEIVSSGKVVTIHRSAKFPKKVEFAPEDADIKSVIDDLQMHPEFALSRREIVKYIITQPGRRSEDVQALLRLENIGKLRKSFNQFNNSCAHELTAAQRNKNVAASELGKCLEIELLLPELILEKVNEKRAILNLAKLEELNKDTSLKSGMEIPIEVKEKVALNKAVALADLSALKLDIETDEPEDSVEIRQVVKESLEKLKDDEQALNLARQHGLITTGMDLISEDLCPLCDTKWDAEELREHLRKKLMDAEQIKDLLEELRENINAMLQVMSVRMVAVDRVIEYCQSFDPPIEKDSLEAYKKQINAAETALNNFLKDNSKIDPALEAVGLLWWVPSDNQKKCINTCHESVNALPGVSAEDEARELLIVAQERYERLQGAIEIESEMEANSALSQKVLDHYCQSSTAVLEGIYDQVSDDFSKFYQIINHDDEEQFVGKLKTEPAKLSFNVDFYGRGLYPPGAYHSEGHQDGMGLCLYLALMKHTLKDEFTFAVLDDVLMSVDTGHRREVCRLLITEFPNTQFILTTHDKVWLQYMKTEGLICRSQLFGGWSVDTGPRIWDDYDIWTEIQAELDKGDVAKAAWLLRRYLEYAATILADNLRAKVEFKGDGRYGLGDLMPPVLVEWRKRLKKGVAVAKSWAREETEKELTRKEEEAAALIAKTNMEQWAINPSVHYNEWANLQPHEFGEVVTAFKSLLESLRCENDGCKSYLYILPAHGSGEEMRCNCGAININLKKNTA